MQLEINNKLINEPIINILSDLKNELNNDLFNTIRQETQNNVICTCPYHKNGRETHPSARVYCNTDDAEVVYGTFHCFTCGVSKQLYSLVGDCFNKDDNFGKDWLVSHYGDTIVEVFHYLEPITLNKTGATKEYLPDSILNQYMYYHPYMWQRKLSKEVVDKFDVGYDKETECLTFPVRDINGKLLFITKRSVKNKSFYIEKGVEKPVYLLYDAIQNNVNTLYVCESQINALTLQSWGYPAVALFGTGSPHQYELLKSCGIRNFILCLDGDAAGQRGNNRFKANMPKNVLISIKCIPEGKDVNDLTKEEFDNLNIM